MADPVTAALTTALDKSSQVAGTPFFATVVDRILGFKLSEWSAQGETIKKQILDGYEEAKQKGLGVQYVSAFRSNANLINTSIRVAKYVDQETQHNVPMDNDVFWGFLEHAKSISNEEMQELIAKILAGEYTTPGSYSMSTLQAVKMLGRTEIETFQKMCSFLINEDTIPQELFQMKKEILSFMQGLDFQSLQTLQSLGLFLPNDMAREIKNPNNQKYPVVYFDRTLLFEPETPEARDIDVPSFYGLSTVGNELKVLLSPEYSEGYFEWLKSNYKIHGYKLISS